jgi:hypothetical protein
MRVALLATIAGLAGLACPTAVPHDRAISSEVGTGSQIDLIAGDLSQQRDRNVSIDRHRCEIATKQKYRAGFRFHRIGHLL